MLNAYFGAIVPLMERSGGEVHQIVGDELMVIFNKQGDTPDHPLRAARAALTLLRTAERVARPDWPRFRVGVNSGDVLAAVVGGATGHRKHGIVGDTVNVAAVFEQAAEPATVVVGAGTYGDFPSRRSPTGCLRSTRRARRSRSRRTACTRWVRRTA